jgi:hypothetical protein
MQNLLIGILGGLLASEVYQTYLTRKSVNLSSGISVANQRSKRVHFITPPYTTDGTSEA